MTKVNARNLKINELLVKVRQFDARAQRELYDLIVLQMYNTALRILKNREDAQDCLQVGFTHLFGKVYQYDSEKGAFISWATRIFINESLRILRQKKIRFDELNDNLYLEAHSMTPIGKLNMEDILTTMNTLPDQMRIIFNLYEIEGYSHKEIGEMLDIAESSSRTYLMRAKKKMRSLIGGATEKKLNIQPNFKIAQKK